MSRAQKPVLVREVHLIWYPITLVPILSLLYFSFIGALPPLMGLIALFVFFFWLFSLGFALYARLRKSPSPRQ